MRMLNGRGLGGRGLGQAGSLIPQVNFVCNANICYGIDNVSKTFVALQQALNRFWEAAGSSVISTDGKIGGQTQASLRKAAAYIISNVARPAVARFAGLAARCITFTLDDIASAAPELTTMLNTSADALNLKNKAPVQGTITYIDSDTGQEVTEKQGPAKWPWFLGAAVFFGGLLYFANRK